MPAKLDGSEDQTLVGLARSPMLPKPCSASEAKSPFGTSQLGTDADLSP